MSTYTFTDEQIEAIVHVIKRTGCSFRVAYAACVENNYNKEAAIKAVEAWWNEQIVRHKLKRMERN